MDPYADLGVSRAATPEEIRAAYRALSRRVHPDAGGGVEEWLRVRQAFEVLSDPARRDQYDRTGTVDGGGTDNSAAELLGILSNCLSAVLTTAGSRGARLEALDLAQEMREALATEVRAVRGQMDSATEAAEGQRALAERFTVRGRPNYVATILLGRARQADATAATLRKRLESLSRAAEYLRGVDFRRDEPESLGFTPFTMFYSTGDSSS